MANHPDNDYELGKNTKSYKAFLALQFKLRPVSFNNSLVAKGVDSALLAYKNRFISEKTSLLINSFEGVLKKQFKAFVNCLPNTNNTEEFGILLNKNYSYNIGNSGILYRVNDKFKIFVVNQVNGVEKGNNFKCVVYKNNLRYFEFIENMVSETSFFRNIGNYSLFYINNEISHVDTIIQSKRVEKVKLDLVRKIKIGAFDV